VPRTATSDSNHPETSASFASAADDNDDHGDDDDVVIQCIVVTETCPAPLLC